MGTIPLLGALALDLPITDAVAARAERDSAYRARLRRALLGEAASAKPTLYTTTTEGPLPAGATRRWLRELAPRIAKWAAEHAPELPRVERRGGKRGKTVAWIVPAVTLDAYAAARRAAANTAPSAVASTTAAVVDLDDWIRSAGYRLSRRSK